MNWYVKRTGQALVTLWAVITIAFVLAWNVPRDAIETLIAEAGSQRNINTDAMRERMQELVMFDTDDSVWEAYLTYLSELSQGNMGYSVTFGQDVNVLIADAIPWTLLVMSIATFGLFGISLMLGAIMAYREGSYFDIGNTGLGIVTTSIPYWVAAILLIMFIGYDNIPFMEWLTQHFPRRYRVGDVESGLSFEFISSALRHATLPALSFILTGYGLLALSMRANSIQVLGEDFVRVAELRGLPRRRIALRYVGRNAVLPLYTSLLLSVGFMLGASVVLEEIFQYRGVGLMMFRSVETGDTALMMATFIVITVCIIIATFVADVTYSMLDPRIKSGDEGEAY